MVKKKKKKKQVEIIKSWFQNRTCLSSTQLATPTTRRLPQKHGDDATLWERDDLTVRYMLEEGKLNVTLRAIVNHRNFLRRRREYEEKVTATANYHKARSVVHSRQSPQSRGLFHTRMNTFFSRSTRGLTEGEIHGVF